MWSGDPLSTPEISPPAAIDSESRRLAEAAVLKGLRIYLVTLLMLTAVAWCVVGVRGLLLHEPYPRNTLFFLPKVRFSDFTDLSERVPYFSEPNVLSRIDIKTTYPYPYPYPYPAPSFYVFLFFVRLFPNGLIAYLTFAVLSFVIAAVCFSLYLQRTTRSRLPVLAVCATLILGFPLAFMIDRGNIEGVIWVLILLGFLAFTRNRMLLSAILWSVAASMKIFPGLLFGMFLARRKFGTFAIAIAATAAFSLLALAGIGPTIRQAAEESSKSAAFLTSNYIAARASLEFDHSLLAAAKQVIYTRLFVITKRKGQEHVSPDDTSRAFLKALRIYNLLIPLCAVLLYWFRLRHLPLLNQFMAFLILCVLLPYVSGEYTLIHMYLAWGAFLLFLLTDVATGRVTIPPKAIYRILISCAVLFAPLSYLLIVNNIGHGFGLGAQVKTVFLIVILWTVLRNPMPSSLFGDLQLSAPDNSRVPS